MKKNESDTPETDNIYFDDCQSRYDLAGLCKKLERERNELQFELNRIYHWIERRNQDGFIDSKSHVSNLDIIWDRMYDRVDNAESDAQQADKDSIRALHERNESREQRDIYLSLLKRSMAWVYASKPPGEWDEMIRDYETAISTNGKP